MECPGCGAEAIGAITFRRQHVPEPAWDEPVTGVILPALACSSAEPVTLRHDTSELACEVTDDGPGITSTGVGSGAGLANMADRIATVGGQLRIDSAPGHCTTIRASVSSPGPPARESPVSRERNSAQPPEGGAGTTENTQGCTLPPDL